MALAHARRFGMDDASLANLRDAMQGPPDDDCGIWPENVDTVSAFLAVASQWRVVAAGGGFAPPVLIYLGLDYAAARVGLDAEGITVTPDLWRGLCVMEGAACAVLNEAKSS